MGKSDVSARFEGVELPPYFRIVPPWRAQEARAAMGGGTLLVLSPGRAFGRGDHETTALCLIAMGYLARCGFSPRRVLDFGSGSGVLAIAAAKLGAEVEAVDISSEANAEARENARLNGVEARVDVRDAMSEPPRRCELVVANVFRPVLLEHATALAARQDRGGHLVLSGLLATDVPAVLAAYTPLLAPMSRAIYARGEWRAVVYSGSQTVTL